MKALFALTLALFLSTPAQADVKVETDCNSYGPTADSLAVAVDEDFVDIGYITSGVFFSIKVAGCRTLSMHNNQLNCDGSRIATAGDFKSTSDDDGRPRAYLKLEVNASITGSCAKNREPLKLNILK